jgi:hypothetical protein
MGYCFAVGCCCAVLCCGVLSALAARMMQCGGTCAVVRNHVALAALTRCCMYRREREAVCVCVHYERGGWLGCGHVCQLVGRVRMCVRDTCAWLVTHASICLGVKF